MNDNQQFTFSCPRCGNEVNNKSRYCMKCGYMNPNHPDNKQYSKLIRKAGKEEYNVNSQEPNSTFVNQNPVSAKGVEIGFGSNTGSFMFCFVLNLLCYLILVIGCVAFFYTMSNGNLHMMLGTELCYILVGLSIFSILQYSVQLVYMKMNQRWWVALIPLVNLYAFSDAIYQKKLLNFLVFVPVVGQIYYLVLLYKMGEAFHVNGFLTLLFPFIMFPVIGFGGQGFRGVCYVSGRDTLEKEYGKKKGFFVLNCVVILASIVMFLYANTLNINRGIDRFSSYYIYLASQRVITRTKLKVENHVYECNQDEGEVLYFYFADLSDYFSIPFYVYRDPIEAYVKVVVTKDQNNVNQYEYYLSMTDLRYGFPETKVEEITAETVQPFTELDKVYESGNRCYFRRTA